MKLPFSWLADYVDLSGITPELLAEKLTMNAFEVENIETFGSDLTGPLVIGEIVDIQAHPDPKVTKMRLTKVKVDDKQEPLEIVCGASNIAVGQRVPVALPGSVVINRHDGTAFPIVAMEKRGVRSNGMICAPSELGVAYVTEEDGIWVLDPAIANRLGEDAYKLLCLEKDTVLTVGSRSNRGDAVCIRGMAREVAAIFERPMREPEWQLIENDGEKSSYSVEIADLKDCEYFGIRDIKNIKVISSPFFIVKRLAAVGTRPINNIVDITNYVMHEWGQPMHAYDARYVSGGKFHIRRGRKEEKFTTLDGKERSLTEETLIVADPEKVIGMPVMGGANTEIRESTQNIALETASFNPAQVRRTSRLLGLSSESGLRFERGVDVVTTKQANDRAAYLIAKYCAGSEPVQIGAYVAGGSDKRPPLNIELRLSEVKRYLNLNLSIAETKNLLSRLGFTATANAATPEKLTFSVPSFRQRDVHREIDLVEEICRIYGYDNIKDESPAFFAVPQMPENISQVIRNAFIGQGFCEAYLSSLVPHTNEKTGKDLTLMYRPNKPAQLIEMRNPLSEEHQVMRQSLLPGLIHTLKYNRDRSQKDVWFFELGYTYQKHTDSNKANQSCPADEALKVAGILVGNPQLGLWAAANADLHTDFFVAKGILENLAVALGIDTNQLAFIGSEQDSSETWLLHPGQKAKIVFAKDNIELGWLGQLHPQQALNWDLDPLTYLFELDIEKLKAIRGKPSFRSLPTQLPVTRDLTVDLPQNTNNAAIISCIKDGTKHLQAVDLVSIYPLNNELKSFSYRLAFQSEESTFKSDEIEQIMNNVRAKLKEKLSASFRG
jgi:phenylalanyl-tRNA synthetase beta chain